MRLFTLFYKLKALLKQNIFNAGNGSSGDFNHMQQEIDRQHSEWAMEECRKTGTPFDMGGYMQGDGFNPSDTAAADAMRDQMNQMNNMF